MSQSLPLRRILIFWAPLFSTWLMMAFEGPFLAAIIARLPEPKFNLAAHGVAFSLALIVEAPIIMMMSASTALVHSRQSYLALRNFTARLNVAITAITPIHQVMWNIWCPRITLAVPSTTKPPRNHDPGTSMRSMGSSRRAPRGAKKGVMVLDARTAARSRTRPRARRR